MINNPLVALLLTALLLAAPVVSAQMVPAQFGVARDEFISRLTVPVLAEGDEILLRCGANVHRNGEMRDIACFENIEHPVESQALVRDIIRVARFVRISAALVGDRATVVWMNFAVRLRQSAAGPEVELFEHHLMNVAALGMDYISAQRFDKGAWGCLNTSKSAELMRARVDATGQIHDVQVSTIRIDQECADRIADAARDSRYIPAMSKGTAVESMYYEMFFWK